MKKFIFLLSFLLFIVPISGQKKKIKKKTVQVPKVIPLLPSSSLNSKVSGQDDVNNFPPIMKVSVPVSIKITNRKGDAFYLKRLEELEQQDLTQLKEIAFSTELKDEKLDKKVLQKVLSEATNLEVLEILYYQIEDFPELKRQNSTLKKLVLKKNKFITLPKNISNFTGLEEFTSDNPLEEIPASFSQLKNLKTLLLYNTEFTAMPEAIFTLNKLSTLVISGRYKGTVRIKELPDLFQQLPQLKEVAFQNASLTNLPKSFSTLKKLTNAEFSDNQFTEFPEVLALNPNLVYVSFSDNPLIWNSFLPSIKKIKWRGLFFLHDTGFTKKQYEELQKILSKIDVYYDGMND